MTKAGLAILAGSVAGTLLTIALWVLGLFLGVGGSLIHLLLVLAITVGPIGFVTGLVLLLLGRQSDRGPRAGS